MAQQNKAAEALDIELVFDRIFHNLTPTHLLPLRLICKTWKERIDKKIGKGMQISFDYDIMFHPDNVQLTHEAIHFFKIFKMSKLILNFVDLYKGKGGWSKVQIKKYTQTVMKAVKAYGPQLKSIVYYKNSRNEPFQDFKAEWQLIKDLLSFTPNLENFEINFEIGTAPFAEVFDNFCHLSLKSFRFPNSGTTNVTLAFVQNVCKSFPNLDTNFGGNQIDCQLLKLITEGKEIWGNGMKWVSKSHQEERYFEEASILLQQLDVKRYPIRKIELENVWDIHEKNVASNLILFFKHFSTTLESLSFVCDIWSSFSLFVMEIPPLERLKEMRLGLPDFIDGKPRFQWNLGKSLAKDFPLLESFSFVVQREVYNIFRCKEWERHYPFEEACLKIWNPVVPIFYDVGGEETGFDLSPLRFIKFVDLLIPNAWIHEDNREWGQKFLATYLKLFGNAGRGNVQNLINLCE